MSSSHFCVIGKIGKAHGVKGFVKIHSYTENPEDILQFDPWYIQIQGNWAPIATLHKQNSGSLLLAQFEGYQSPEQVRPLINQEIAVPRHVLAAPLENQFYYSDLLGCDVYNLAECYLGQIIEVFENMGQDIIHVKGKREYLIPFRLSSYIVSVNLDQRRLTVDWDEDF